MSARQGVAQFHKGARPEANPSDPFWREKANCRDANPRIFFDADRYAEALTVCNGCPIQAECLSERHGAPGVWGGRVYQDKGGDDEPVNVHDIATCGTEAGHQRHRRRREKPCNAYITASTIARQARKDAKR